MSRRENRNGKAVTRASVYDVMALLSNPIRVEILAALTGAEKCVSQIADELEIDASTVSHSLRQLGKFGLVAYKAVEKQHIYRLTGAVTGLATGRVIRLAVSAHAQERVLMEAQIRTPV